ncbi:MAG: hypothetical protein CVU97_05030 [Firmicutes bacterium HGW-Firmicutes-21]|nr:MAG: hypothetical protein CVU97_05030 [Firmicutes bacterium HGW-Firmicutes-21]
MPQRNRMLPLWLHFAVDLLLIAFLTTSFYYAYYRLPRNLESENIVINRRNDNHPTYNDYSSENHESELDKDSWVVKFADKFTDSLISTEDSYTSPDISVKLTRNTIGSGKDTITYYLADIYIADIECLQTGFAKDTYGVGYTENVIDMHRSLSAILAINGDYYGNGADGTVIRNGIVYRTKADSSDICVLYYDGTMRTYTADKFDISKAAKDGAYQAWSFGPSLLDNNGGSLTEFPTSRRILAKNPRTVIGYFEPGHYCFVLVDGRDTGYSSGMTMSELSSLMSELGCKVAYNLDGGQTSVMTFIDSVVNRPYEGGRKVSDCIIIKERKNKK